VTGSGWRARYEQRTVTAEQALKDIRSGSGVFIGSGCGQPQLLFDALMRMAPRLSDIEILHGMTLGVVGSTDSSFAERFRHNAFFVSEGVTSAVSEGRADYTPIGSFRIPSMFSSGRIPVDAALIQVSPPDEAGFCSLGVSVGITRGAAESASYVVAEVNPRMPRTFGNSLIHVNDIDAFVAVDLPLVEVQPPASPSHVAQQIAHNCVRLIEDGATIRLGANAIAWAVARELIEVGRSDLGIHSDYMTEGVMEMMLAGVVNNSRKRESTGKSIACRCIGTRKLFDFVHDNPQVEMHTTADVCDPEVIARHERMVAIVRGFQVDLMGQVSDGIGGGRFHGGFGGRADFIRGSARSAWGKPIIVIPSTTRDGEESTIKMFLDPGSEVVALGADTHYVVTEWGTAFLHGRSIRERAVSLIHIAHPKFRKDLMDEAKRARFVYQDQLLPRGEAPVYPEHLEATVEFGPDLKVFFRPVLASDERKVQSFVYRLGDRSIRYRFNGEVRVMNHSLVQGFVNVDYSDTMTMIGLLGEVDREKGEVVAMGQFLRYPQTNVAEVAFITLDRYQNRGIGTWLLHALARYARQCSIEGFFAEVVRDNHRMIRVFQKCGFSMQGSVEDGAYTMARDLRGRSTWLETTRG
jgi:acyl-CoA hydrolase/GNAT superfamily N-acetyltransferase